MASEREWTFPCEYLENYDGDSLDIRLDLGFGISKDITVRLHGVDTPELRGGEDLTKRAAAYARDKASEFLSGKNLLYRSVEWAGKYGRAVGDIEADGASLAHYLLDNRLGLAYDGGNRSSLYMRHRQNALWLQERGEI